MSKNEIEMSNKQAEAAEPNEQEQSKIEPANHCLDFDALRLVIKYQKALPSAVENIVALIDEIEASGVGYVSIEEVKETLLKSFNDEE